MNTFFKQFVCLIFFFICLNSFSQTLPVGTPFLEEALRRKQIKGEIDINTSFTVRPIYTSDHLPFDSIYDPVNYFSNKKDVLSKETDSNKSSVKLLPIVIRQQYNSH